MCLLAKKNHNACWNHNACCNISPRGQVAAQWGATYPIVYEYDDFNRMVKLHTLRDPNVPPQLPSPNS
ncbi:MAG: hypothetical protein JJU29_03140 [Verrucomicrobia bacterium]|nr:hypothetical protein [Verrucomicrobiota bacterium]MCH8510768.1 hypothetical protein [Kiritimatiellia bacterium]